MGWTAPLTFATSQLVTAACLNQQIRDNMLYLKSGFISGGTVQYIYYDSLSGKNPVVDAVTYSNWSLCDGGTYNGFATPNLVDKFLVGASSTYAIGATGGATTSAHTHGPGTLTTGDNDADHNHANVATGAPSGTTNVDNNLDFSSVAVGSSLHTHTQGATGLVSANHGHAVNAGTTASTSPAILPPYHAVGVFMFCPA